MAGHTLKQYPIHRLKPGMVLGRTIYDTYEQMLLVKGTVLTKKLISYIAERGVCFALIDEETNAPKPAVSNNPLEENPPAAPPQPLHKSASHVLDDSFVSEYKKVFAILQALFSNTRSTGTVDLQPLNEIDSRCLKALTDGLKAITNVHNISREGYYLIHHSINVAILAGLLGRWLKFTSSDLYDLILAGLLHDIGKTQIPTSLLNKPSKLTAREYAEVQKHTERGYKLLRATKLKGNAPILFGILQHHERLDGSGYPFQVKSEKIHTFAKLLAIADIYDAMASNKVYARKKSPFDIFAELSKEMTHRLDTSYCVLFIKNLCHAMNGNWVKLDNGANAKIVYIDESRISALPIVQCETGEFIDLNKEKEIHILELQSTAQ